MLSKSLHLSPKASCCVRIYFFICWPVTSASVIAIRSQVYPPHRKTILTYGGIGSASGSPFKFCTLSAMVVRLLLRLCNKIYQSTKTKLTNICTKGKSLNIPGRIQEDKDTPYNILKLFFHITQHIHRPEICTKCLRVKRCKAKARGEEASKLTTKIN